MLIALLFHGQKSKLGQNSIFRSTNIGCYTLGIIVPLATCNLTRLLNVNDDFLHYKASCLWHDIVVWDNNGKSVRGSSHYGVYARPRTQIMHDAMRAIVVNACI